jgi:hypothetical protein
VLTCSDKYLLFSFNPVLFCSWHLNWIPEKCDYFPLCSLLFHLILQYAPLIVIHDSF